jgi:hypothetical protein
MNNEAQRRQGAIEVTAPSHVQKLPKLRGERAQPRVTHKEESMQRFSGLKCAARVAVIALSACVALCGAGARAFALPTLDELMADFAFSRDDVQRVRNGELVKTATKETSDKELAVVMVFLAKAPVQKLITFFEVGRGFRNDPNVQWTTEISGAGTLDDFKGVVLDPGGDKETQRYLNAAPGDTLNLSATEIAAFQGLKGSGGAGQAQVEQALRQMLLARYQAYRSQGLAGIAPYARSKDKLTEPADDLRRATEAAKGLKKHVPAFYYVLLDYPKANSAGLTQRFFCLRYAISGRPNLTLRHRLAMPVDDAYVVADREFYVSHDYNETQAVAGLLPVADGTVVVYLNRTTTDHLGGFGASAKRVIGSTMMTMQISELFDKARMGFKDK